jgi:hypothetical protein
VTSSILSATGSPARAILPAGSERTALELQFGSARRFDGRLFALEAVTGDLKQAQVVAADARRYGRHFRITQVGNRGVRLTSGRRAKNTYAIWSARRTSTSVTA